MALVNLIKYLNTDLDVESSDDLSQLAAALKMHGLHSLHEIRVYDERWCATFETDETFDQPDPNIATMLAAVESLNDAMRSVWFGCSLREFNIGYDCGDEPWAFSQSLSSDVLKRLAAVGATLRVTIYPVREPAPVQGATNSHT